jgi:hypothetical protein
VGRPVEALDEQLTVLRMLRSPLGLRFATRAFQGVVEESYDLAPSSPEIIGALQQGLAGGTTYWVSQDMVSLTEAAASNMPGQPLLVSDLPSPQGFVWFDRPTRLVGHYRGPAPCAASWHLPEPDAPSVVVSWYLTRAAYCAETREDEGEVIRRGMGWPVLPVRWNQWAFGRSYRHAWQLGDEADSSQEPGDGARTTLFLYCARRFLQALWSIMTEPYVVTDAGHLDRPHRRRAEREGVNQPTVRVITLRPPRRRDTPGSAQPVAWSHRWLVTGHWRHQWYPSTQTHRLRYIPAYVKGPADKPLLTDPKIYALRR